jgi:hypothetical protein
MRLTVPVFALLLCGSAVLADDRNRREYELQPASLFLFEESRPLSPCDPVSVPAGKKSMAYLDASGNQFVLHRKDELSISRSQVSGLTVRPTFASVAITAEQRDSYSVNLCVSAGKIDGADASQVLDRIRLSRNGDTLTLAAPSYDSERPSRAELQIAAPKDLPLTADAAYAAIDLTGMTAPVKIRTTHARIKIMNTSGSVDAESAEFGVVDFAGERGQVQLRSATEINLKLTATSFDGRLQASAKQSVRIILPDGFSTPFEVRVRKASNFICRAPLCGQVKHERRDDGEWISFGATDAALRFEASDGPVLIDSLEQLRAAWDKQEREAREKAADFANQTRQLNDVAGSIHSEAEARRFVELLWKRFSDGGLKWVPSSILDRVARAEYAAVARGKVIPEERIANSFNTFMQRLEAPDWTHVTAEELRTMRVGELVTARATWNSYPNIWTMPNVYHVDSNGNLAPGCRAVEALKLLYTLNELFTNVFYAREHVRQGPDGANIERTLRSVPSEAQIRENRATVARGWQREQELRQIKFIYAKQHGAKAYEELVRQMIEGVLP